MKFDTLDDEIENEKKMVKYVRVMPISRYEYLFKRIEYRIPLYTAGNELEQ